MSLEADYIREHYGICSLGGSCSCLKPNRPWLGTLCLNWTPCGAKTWKELIDAGRENIGR